MHFFNTKNTRFVTVHNNAIKLWTLDVKTSKLAILDCALSQNKRFINCVTVDPTDTYIYCGTRTGDILEILVESASYKRAGPVQKLFHGGIHQINIGFPNCLIVSTAKGAIARINATTMVFEDEVNLESGPVVSLTNSMEKIYALTAGGSMFSVLGSEPLANVSCFTTSITNPVSAIHFPAGFGEIFAMRSRDEIRIWNVADQRELLRITLQEHEGQSPFCNVMDFMPDGKSIVSGWTDGKIRAFTPQSGRLLYIIREGHRINNN